MAHIIKQISDTSDDLPKARYFTLESLSFLAFNYTIAYGISDGYLQNSKGLQSIAILLVLGTVYAWFQFVRSNGAKAHYLFGLINAQIALYMFTIALYAMLWGLIGALFDSGIEFIIIVAFIGALACGGVWLWTRTFVQKFQSYPGFVASINKQYETSDQVIMRDEEEGLVVLEL